MVVVITNLTDGPGAKPREVRIFNTRLLPGKSIRIQAQYVDEKMRAIEETGHISIGSVPSWYSDHKSKRVLTADEVVASRDRAASVAKAKADAKKKFLGKAATAPTQPAPAPTGELALVDKMDEADDQVKTEKKSSKNRKRR